MSRYLALAVLALHGLAIGQSCLTSTFAGPTNATIGGAVYLDLGVTSANGITLSTLDLNLHGVATGVTVGCELWARFGSTYVGNELVPGWVYLGAGTGTMTTAGSPTTMTFASPIWFPTGVHGVAIAATGGTGHRYTTGNGTNQSFSDANISLSLGSATNVPFTAAVFTPRVANLTVCYNQGGSAAYPWFTTGQAVGAAPLAVAFTDVSWSGAPGGVLVWRWDFDGDSVFDVQGSTPAEQNPTWVYANPGTYSVTLEILDANGPTSRTRTNLVRVAALTNNTDSADILHFPFNEPPRAGSLSVYNAAASQVAPTFATMSTAGWQGDPLRPAFQTGEPGYGCLQEAGVISVNHVATGWPLDAQDMTISWWHRIGSFGGGTANAFAYVFGGNGSQAVRCFVEGAAGTGRLRYAGSQVGDFNTVADIKTGRTDVWTHVTLVVDNAAGLASWYIDGVLDNTKTFAPGTHRSTNTEFLVGRHNGTQNYSLFYSMDDFRLYGRVLQPAEIAALAAGAQAATTTNYGVGCPGSQPAAPRAGSAGGAPAIGNSTYTVTVAGAEPGAIGLALLGLYQNQLGAAGGALPLDVSFLGLGFAPGCNLEVGEVLATPLVILSPTGGGSVGLPIPAVPSLAGSHFHAQWAVLSASSALSDAVHICVR